MKIQAFDDSCSLYTLLSPSSFETTPPHTLGDDWSDMTMAVNDGSNAYALWNQDVFVDYDPNTFDDYRGGVEIVLPGQSPTTALIHNYSKGTIDYPTYNNDYQMLAAISGAFSANGTILVPPIYIYENIDGGYNGNGNGTTIPFYPRLSIDFGATFNDVTGLPVHQRWTRACFSANAAVMYIHQLTTGVWKSTNGGATWTFLSNSPAFAQYANAYATYVTPGLYQNSLRMRCSADGQTIAMIDWSARFYVSKDGGATWHATDFGVTYDLGGVGQPPNAPNPGSVVAADFGMTVDGSQFSVMVSWSGPFIAQHVPLRTNNTGIWGSPDGVNWTNNSVKLPSGKNQQPAAQRVGTHCFLSATGSHHVVLYTRSTVDPALGVDASYTHGRSFRNDSNVTINPNTGGNLVAAFFLLNTNGAVRTADESPRTAAVSGLRRRGRAAKSARRPIIGGNLVAAHILPA